MISIPELAIRTSLSEVLEAMYFMSPTYCGESMPGVPTLGVVVTFSGQVCGTFQLYVARDLARKMTSDFLACDPEALRDEQIQSAVMELANVACGSSMSAWMPSVNFEYGVPRPALLPTAPVAHSFAVLSEQPEIFLNAIREN